jgi:RNA polymerase sigma-70 factor (ECF subfamily)
VNVSPSRGHLDAAAPAAAQHAAEELTFAAVYEEHFPFVWRSVRRLGVSGSVVDDIVQEIFVIVHRRLGSFEARSSVKTWLFGIVRRVVRDHRRTLRRKSPWGAGAADVEAVAAADAQGPHEQAAQAEAARVLHEVLDELDDEKREVFVLAELEQMTAPEIAAAVSVPLNTVYSRLRIARQEFEGAVARRRARDGWRLT